MPKLSVVRSEIKEVRPLEIFAIETHANDTTMMRSNIAMMLTLVKREEQTEIVSTSAQMIQGEEQREYQKRSE